MSRSNERSKSVKPHWGERNRMALWCRKDLSPTQRLVLAVLADLCIHDRPTEVLKLSVQTFARITGFERKAVGQALQALIDKGLIRRQLAGRNAWRMKRRTSINWALIRENQLDWSELTDDEDDIEMFPNVEYDEPSEEEESKPLEPEPAKEITKSSEPMPQPSVKSTEPSHTFVDTEEPSPAPNTPTETPHPEPQAALSQEPLGALLVRLLGPDHSAYPNTKSRNAAIAALVEFDDDPHLREALEWTLTVDGTEWGEQLRNQTASPHKRLPKVRDLVVQEYQRLKKSPKCKALKQSPTGGPVDMKKVNEQFVVAELAKALGITGDNSSAAVGLRKVLSPANRLVDLDLLNRVLLKIKAQDEDYAKTDIYKLAEEYYTGREGHPPQKRLAYGNPVSMEMMCEVLFVDKVHKALKIEGKSEEVKKALRDPERHFDREVLRKLMDEVRADDKGYEETPLYQLIELRAKTPELAAESSVEEPTEIEVEPAAA